MRPTFHNWNNTPSDHSLVHSLPENDVQVWTATVPSTDLTSWRSLLAVDEQARAERFRVEAPRRQYIFARATLRQILGACLNVGPNLLAFSVESRGKPFLCHPVSNPLQFNLSHADQYIAVALSRRRRVGVDIESTHLHEWQELAPRIFSKRELAELHALPESQRRAGFFKGWTGKEAYLKATGEGLINDLPSLEVSVAPGAPPKLVTLPAGSTALNQWQIFDIPLPTGMAGAVVCETP